MTVNELVNALVGFTKWTEVEGRRVRDSPRDFLHVHVHGVLSGSFGIETPVDLSEAAASYGFYELPEVVQALVHEALVDEAKRNAIRSFLGLRH